MKYLILIIFLLPISAYSYSAAQIGGGYVSLIRHSNIGGPTFFAGYEIAPDSSLLTGNAYYQYFNMNYDYTYSGSDSFSSFGLGVSLYSGYNHMAGIMLTGNMIITGQTVYMGGIHGRLNIFDTRILGLEAMASMYIHTEEDAFYCLNLIFKIY